MDNKNLFPENGAVPTYTCRVTPLSRQEREALKLRIALLIGDVCIGN